MQSLQASLHLAIHVYYFLNIDLERKLSAIGKVEEMSTDSGGKSSELQLKV